jgi:hypothetical protein
MSQAQVQPKESSPPQSQPIPAQSQPSQETSQPKTEAPAAVKKPATSKPRARKKAPPKKRRSPSKTAPPKPDGSPGKRVVRNGSATEPAVQISPSVPQQQASSQLQNTNNLLNTADANLKSISGAQLNAGQEEMVKQVRTYMEQAKAAAGAGDLERANNLATKAQLLSAELAKH